MDKSIILGALILSHLLALLVGVEIGKRVDWQMIRQDPGAFRYVLAAIVLLAAVAAVIVATRGVAP